MKNQPYPLKNAFILDLGATIHICNMAQRLTHLRPPSPLLLGAGDAQIWIKGYGTVHIKVKSPYGTEILRLENVAFCPEIIPSLSHLDYSDGKEFGG